MKILLINSVCGTGSTGRIIVEIYKMLEKYKHECCIAYGRGNAPTNIRTIKIGNDLDVYHHGIMTRITDKQGFYSKNATKKFIQSIHNFNPDIIHLHNIHGYYINIELLFQYLKDCAKPVVWTLHDCWAFTGHCAYFDFANCYKWEEGCYQCSQKRQYPSSFFKDNSRLNFLVKRSLFTSVDKLDLVVPSSWLKSKVSASFFSKNRCRVINNGIDSSIFAFCEGNLRIKHHLDSKHIILGVANVWDKRKGLDIFIELSKILPCKYQIVLVGLTKHQKKMLPYNILGIEKTECIQELAEWYSLADIYFNASVEETMGLTTIEALACGTPVLVFDKTAVPEFVTKQSGVILDKCNVNEVHNTIIQTNWNLFSNTNCRKQALLFEKSLKYNEYYDIYNEILLP